MRRDYLIYLILCLLFFAYKIVEVYSNNIYFLHSYFEDIIALPIILKSSLLIINRGFKRFKSYRIALIDVVIITVGFSFYYEWLLPKLDSRFSSDIYDVLCYFLGMVIFLFYLNRPTIQAHEQSSKS